MTAYNVVNRAALQAGQPEDVSQVLANLDAIAAVLNGNLDDFNLKAGANIAAAKLAAGAAGQILGMTAGVPTWVGGGWQKIDEKILGAPATMNFNPINQNFKHLAMVGALATQGGADNYTYLGVNGDATLGNYVYALLELGGSVPSQQVNNNATACLPARCGGLYFTPTLIFFPNYMATTTHRGYVSLYYALGVSATYLGMGGGKMGFTTAWNSIGLSQGAGGSFTTGSMMSLYGIN